MRRAAVVAAQRRRAHAELAATAQGSSVVQLTEPANVQTAPPGHYMLFVLNANRIPSIAKFVRVAP